MRRRLSEPVAVARAMGPGRSFPGAAIVLLCGGGRCVTLSAFTPAAAHSI